MLAARGVSLGLGKINLSDLNQLPGGRLRRYEQKREKPVKKPKIRIKKKADAKTVWAACRAVLIGSIVIVVGLAMTVIGYFDKHFSEKVAVVEGVESLYYDKFIQYQLKSMQYLGPVLMGIGSFILIIACVVTLESRDKHTEIISDDAICQKRRRLLSIEDEAEMLGIDKDAENSQLFPSDSELKISSVSPSALNQQSTQLRTLAEIHHPRIDLAPLADMDSLDLHSCSSEVPTDRDLLSDDRLGKPFPSIS